MEARRRHACTKKRVKAFFEHQTGRLPGAARQIIVELAGGRRLRAPQANRADAPAPRRELVVVAFAASAYILAVD
jgi:hypothetical protein